MVWTCLPFIRSGQNHLTGHSERGEEDEADRKRGGKTNYRKWTGLEFVKSQRAVKNRRKLVAKSPVVPQRPSKIKNRRFNDDDDLDAWVLLCLVMIKCVHWCRTEPFHAFSAD